MDLEPSSEEFAMVHDYLNGTIEEHRSGYGACSTKHTLPFPLLCFSFASRSVLALHS